MHKTENATQSNELLQLMRCCGHTQTSFAKALGVSVPAVNHWLYGRKLPKPDKFGKISELLDISTGELRELFEQQVKRNAEKNQE